MSRPDTVSKGFTVIETIIVILIIGILAVVVLTRSGYYFPIKLNGAGEKLLSDIRYAKRLAMTAHQIYGVLFEVSGNSYTVYGGTSATPGYDPHNPGRFLQVDYDNIRYYNGIGITSAGFGGTNEVRFDSFGVPYDGNGVELSTSGQVTISYEGSSVTITVTPRTGKISG